MPDSLSRAQARRTAISAQLLTSRARTGSGIRRLASVLDRMAVLQIDSVNVFARSHYVPLLSRVGAYRVADADKLLFSSRPAYTEVWAHVASFVAATDWPLLEQRRRRARERATDPDSWVATHRQVVDDVRSALETHGPQRAADVLADAPRGGRGPWWDWDDVKLALEHLWRMGEVAIAGRRGFERIYARTDQVLSPAVLERQIPDDEALRRLVARAARACGVSSAADLADYWRLSDRPALMRAIRELEDTGELIPVRVDGWNRGERPLPAWRHREATVPRRISASALLTPFDPLVWFRDRAERLFDFTYRIEIYTPAAQRRYGYYSLPVLLDDAVVGRVDLKADRARGVLLVQSAWWERTAPPGAAERVSALLSEAAAWQGLEDVSISDWGDAVEDLATVHPGALRHPRTPAGDGTVGG